MLFFLDYRRFLKKYGNDDAHGTNSHSGYKNPLVTQIMGAIPPDNQADNRSALKDEIVDTGNFLIDTLPADFLEGIIY